MAFKAGEDVRKLGFADVLLGDTKFDAIDAAIEIIDAAVHPLCDGTEASDHGNTEAN